MLHKQHGKEKVMVLCYTQYHSERTIFWISPLVDSEFGVNFAILFTLWASLSASVYNNLEQKSYWGNKFWSRGYCVVTVGLDAEMIQKYVQHQQAKEQRIDKQRQLF